MFGSYEGDVNESPRRYRTYLRRRLNRVLPISVCVCVSSLLTR